MNYIFIIILCQCYRYVFGRRICINMNTASSEVANSGKSYGMIQQYITGMQAF